MTTPLTPGILEGKRENPDTSDGLGDTFTRSHLSTVLMMRHQFCAELHELIKDAHLNSDFSELDTCELLHKQRISWCCHFKVARGLLQEIDEDAAMTSLVHGEEELDIWIPQNANEYTDIITHVQSLHIPLTRPRLPPHIIMHDLGGFQNTPTLKSRLDRIFPTDGSNI
ncbi:hypothetical protein Moror_13732 [Moniliophthora roreri MCA 2997]|uniref:Uncharacterized protein n=1 Tax=Moniliophthora roreri (strain MCA 2997) TaxID=1381753 RepID=V2YF96_MONRO|nr:hypothetical protein Moror_13732 [Moniliophthora roreri MCA 2997]